MDTTTRYLGLRLRSPLVASAGPLTGSVDHLRELEEAGIAAVVLPSLFEEQVVHDELRSADLLGADGDGNPEATSYFPDLAGFETVADRHLRHVAEAKAAIEVPVIASLNGSSPGGWVRYARLLEDAGADAIELNLYRVVADPTVSASEVEADQAELIAAVRAATSVPLAVKVGAQYSAFAHVAAAFVAAGADGLVLFNRFYQPDIDPRTRRIVASLDLSTSEELRQPLRWTALLHGRLATSLAITTGVHTGLDAARGLLAGADVVMMTSALLHHGPGHVATVERDLVAWAEGFEVEALAELRGSVSQRNVRDPELLERANYIDTLVGFAAEYVRSHGSPRSS